MNDTHAVILCDEDVEDDEIDLLIQQKIEENKSKIKITDTVKGRKKKTEMVPLMWFYDLNPDIIEIGVDEAGRGPMFGRVYASAVVLPKSDCFDHSQMKDSKKFHSKKKIEEVAEYIKQNSIAWSTQYESEDTIDEINILQATQSAMHKSIREVIKQLKQKGLFNHSNTLLLIDGNYFKEMYYLTDNKTKAEYLNYKTIEGGDNKYTGIAAASILSKVARDIYIEDLCKENPDLIEKYGIDSNKGYGSKKHMEGIKIHGITKWHRKTFGICKSYC